MVLIAERGLRIQTESIPGIKTADIQVPRELPSRIKVGIRAQPHDGVSPFSLLSDLHQPRDSEIGARPGPSSPGQRANTKQTRIAMDGPAAQFFLMRDVIDRAGEAS